MKTEKLLLENVIGIFSRINYTGVFEASSTKPLRLRSPTKSFSKNIKHTQFKSRYPNPNKEKPILSTLYPDGESAVEAMREIVDYVTALAIIVFIADGEIADKESSVLKAFYSQAKTELNKFPDENHIEWAQEKVSDPQNFMKLAAYLDHNNDSCISQTILGYQEYNIGTHKC